MGRRTRKRLVREQSLSNNKIKYKAYALVPIENKDDVCEDTNVDEARIIVVSMEKVFFKLVNDALSIHERKLLVNQIEHLQGQLKRSLESHTHLYQLSYNLLHFPVRSSINILDVFVILDEFKSVVFLNFN